MVGLLDPGSDARVPAREGGTVVNLARGTYDGHAFERTPVLADALEDAGCTDPDLLGHLRGPGPHARGCWVVDALLGGGRGAEAWAHPPAGGSPCPLCRA